MSIGSIGMEPITIDGLVVIHQAGDSSCIAHRDLALPPIVDELALNHAFDWNFRSLGISLSAGRESEYQRHTADSNDGSFHDSSF